jgi:hypothetical protein
MFTLAPWKFEKCGAVTSSDGQPVAADVTPENGKLIAQAPELLRVLKQLISDGRELFGEIDKESEEWPSFTGEAYGRLTNEAESVVDRAEGLIG